MEIASLAWEYLPRLLPTALILVGSVVVLLVANYLLLGRDPAVPAEDRLRRQLAMLALTGVAVVAVILSLPIAGAERAQLLGLLGLLLSAAIALSSTTFMGNAMAGFMLRVVKNFRGGDFLQVGDHFGRVSDRGLFHVEIQTEDSDLTTLPNLYLVTHPVKVVRAEGTVVSATVSLGYDVPRARVEELLLGAATQVGLAEPFVRILDLGDFSVCYRAAGLLSDVKQLLTTRSRLRAAMLDALHGAGIEIVSPSFMNQRALPPERLFVPAAVPQVPPPEVAPEATVFEKAEEAGVREQLTAEYAQLQQQLAELGKARAAASDDAERTRLEDEIERAKDRINELKPRLDADAAS